MKRSIKLKIEKNPSLLKTLSTCNSACNDILKTGFEKAGWEKNELHHATYYKIREKYPRLPSSLVCTARDQASAMLKRDRNKILPVKGEFSAIRFNARTISIDFKKNCLSMASVDGRIKMPLKLPGHFEKFAGWKAQAATLGMRNGNLFLCLNVESPDVPKMESKNVLGIDRGVLNPAVTSDNRFFNAREIRKVKGRYQYLRSRLQAKGTRSAKRKLKRLSGRVNRFMADANHRISKEIVNSDADTFSLERLHIGKKKRNGKRFNRLLGTWAYAQLQEFVGYKADEMGKSVVYVNPRHTSQTCSKCGFRKKANRNGSIFRCKKCGFELHSDLNAARNIASLGKSEIGRLSVNQPIVASRDPGFGNLGEDSYKPPFSNGGS
jgi:IS605 OrfB family transposase